MEVANTLGYYDMATIIVVKCFTVQTPSQSSYIICMHRQWNSASLCSTNI